jgi:uncharacterized protein (DUF1810 family)
MSNSRNSNLDRLIVSGMLRADFTAGANREAVAMKRIDDEFDLKRFVDAQLPVYDAAVSMLHQGKMCSEWMGIIFPSFTGCYNEGAERYLAIGSLEEARAFLAHFVLGNQYRQALRALNWLYDAEPAELLVELDLKRLHSSLTLFAEASDETDLREMLAIWFGCRAEELTISQLDLVPR